MKIVELKAENVKRLKAVHIVPSESMTTIGGKNRAGKSSVLDSIAFALGGQELVPEEPIRAGETSAIVQVDLGDFIVTRKFTRDVIDDPEGGGTKYGPTRSTLTVKNREGASYPSPQAMLDKLHSSLAFDPRAFAQSKPKAQAEMLRRITNLDFTLLDDQRRDLFAERTALNKQVTASKVRLEALPSLFVDTPVEEVSATEVNEDLKIIRNKRKTAEDLAGVARDFRNLYEKAVSSLEEHSRTVADLQLKLELAKADMKKADTIVQSRLEAYNKAAEEANAAEEAIPEEAELVAKLVAIDEVNAKVRHNAKIREAQKAHEELVAQAKAKTEEIEAIDRKKAELIAAVQFPVPGLGFGEEGVTLNGLPFEQASTSEQLSVSVAVGLALNPKLRVLLVRNGESLDSESMTLLGQLAEQHQAQLWVERMTETREGVSVMIEDGEVV